MAKPPRKMHGHTREENRALLAALDAVLA